MPAEIVLQGAGKLKSKPRMRVNDQMFKHQSLDLYSRSGNRMIFDVGLKMKKKWLRWKSGKTFLIFAGIRETR